VSVYKRRRPKIPQFDLGGRHRKIILLTNNSCVPALRLGMAGRIVIAALADGAARGRGLMDSHSPSPAHNPLENRSAQSVLILHSYVFVFLMQGRRLIFKYLYVYLGLGFRV
jgi:hypothetical protein